MDLREFHERHQTEDRVRRSRQEDLDVTFIRPSSDALQFFRAWMQNPLGIASVTPSSRSLAQLITSEIDGHTGRVMELGPGTGVFTRALLERGVSETDLTLVEREYGFAEMLKSRYPLAHILNMDAARVKSCAIDNGQIGATVSGLPLLSMSPKLVIAILDGSFSHMDRNGRFYQFTYGPKCPVRRELLDRLGLRAVRIGGTLQNFPPAAVYRISRRKPMN
jgi:phosphatidylethanolamine/phosphatidyl-N-methylethanolamine N-methyltransferase